jgi:thioredoxin reductase (NADPH)
MAGTRYVTAATLQARTVSWLAAAQGFGQVRPLPPLGRAALLVLDLQRYFADPTSHAFLPALEASLGPALGLAAAFRAAGRPVVFTRHGAVPGEGEVMRRFWRDELRRGDARAELCEAAAALAPDLLLEKARYSAFSGTPLRSWLAERGCEVVVLCGVMTHLCVESTAREAFMLDLEPVLAADACASTDEELHLGALRSLAHGFAVVTSSREIAAALGSPAPRPEPTTSAAGGPLDLCVVGAGPAGIAAAIQAHRSGLRVALLEGDRPGGQARAAERIENYPGFPGGIRGDMLMERCWAQARGLGLERCPLTVDSVAQDRGGFLLHAGAEQPRARAVLLATGAAPLPLAGVDLAPLGARAVYRIDALRTVRGASVLVVGGGEAALDAAIHARRRGAARALVLVRGAAPRAIPPLLARAREHGVEIQPGARLLAVESAGDSAHPARLRVELAGAPAILEADALCVCVGKRPALPIVPAELERDERGAPRVDALGRSSIPGLYLCGDLRRGPYRQVAIAVGDGVAAAMHAHRYLEAADPLSVWRE